MVVLGVVVSVLLGEGPARSAECHTETVTHTVAGLIIVSTVEVCTGGTEPGSSTDVVTLPPPTHTDVDSLCIHLAELAGVAPEEICTGVEEEGDPPEVTPGLVAAALRAIPLPPSALQVQPPNGRTLVNFDTNFFTATREFDRTVVLLGQRVELHIVPSSFTWQFGDGESATTSDPGAPYPELDVTHTYLQKGLVGPSVDTTYTAQFRVGGGPWRDVPGSVTIAGAPVDLQVLTATPTLVGYN